jgi:hypothetical protein
MLVDCSELLGENPPYAGYGVAVADLDGDLRDELFVCGFGLPNRVLHWAGGALADVDPGPLGDPAGQAIGAAAGDLDGDGAEELYVLNTDTFAGPKRIADRLYDGHPDGDWVDLFGLAMNDGAVNRTAGRSVCVLDRLGRGRYGFVVANYGGPFRLVELDPDGRLVDEAEAAGLARTTGGRALVALPLVTDRMDVFAANEHGPNFLFANLGNGKMEEVATAFGLADPNEHGRGVAVVDGEGGLELACGNWEGPHRLWRPRPGGGFVDAAPPAMARPSRVRTVIAADLDNDGHDEIFFNNIGEPNRLFALRDGRWGQIDAGAASEPDGLGTGAAVADVDGDGALELLVVHGETDLQPLSLYKVAGAAERAWIRVRPRTRAGAPARGAVVRVQAAGRTISRVIDSGSGYLCQMEPVAHVGLGDRPVEVDWVEVRWPDGATRRVEDPPVGLELDLSHPG